ncbi:hypothetical protein LCGC14_1073080 [marine sediment metagenome]|uniref:Uncharacterized protein n=1 Tax=marine sediment metagenome TaxID=412755 RepID=A0A0F9MMJ5_9ZZZZ
MTNNKPKVYEHGTPLLNDSVDFFDKSKSITNGISSVKDYNVGVSIDYYKDVKLIKIK